MTAPLAPRQAVDPAVAAAVSLFGATLLPPRTPPTLPLLGGDVDRHVRERIVADHRNKHPCEHEREPVSHAEARD